MDARVTQTARLRRLARQLCQNENLCAAVGGPAGALARLGDYPDLYLRMVYLDTILP